MKPKVLVVENDSVAPIDLVATWLTQAGLELEIIRPHAGDQMPAEIPHKFHGLLVLGGRMGAHDDEEYGWLTAQLVGQSIPVTVFIDESGQVTYQHNGAIKSTDELRRLILEHLGL